MGIHMFNERPYTGGGGSLSQLSDVNITNPQNGQGLKYNATTQKFENGDISTVGSLSDLNDVDINSPQEGDVLVSDENGVYQNKPKSLYPSAPTMTWAEYQQLVDDEEDDPDAEYFIDDIDVSEAYYVETSGQTALTGATSLTFTNSHIKPTADIRILAEPASCKVSTNPQYKVSAKLSSVGNGTATITFPALAENTEFWLLIECPLAITQNDETKADKIDLTSINVIGSTNTTGSTISAGTYFYLNGLLARAKADIATNATFTLNTNYEVVTAGGLNRLSQECMLLGSPNFGDMRQINDALNVSLTNRYSVGNSPACVTSNAINKPSDCYMGWRTVYYLQTNFVMLYLIGFTTNSKVGIWINSYNGNVGNWTGWQKITTT